MNDSFFSALIDDGRPLIKLVALILIGAGLFAIGQAATGHFLPHDTQYLGMSAQQLCSLHGCRIVHFMIHDRISFGGVLVAIGVMYLWLAMFPLRDGQRWAWWTLVASGTTGFLSFLTYLGYGYLDTWHGASTIVLLPLFVWGLVKTRKLIGGRASRSQASGVSPGAERDRARRPIVTAGTAAPLGPARILLLLSTAGMVGGGLTIMTVGMTTVFVPQDLEFMGLEVARLRAINEHLVPLIAHDRAGFGGGLASCGVAMLLTVWFAPMTRSLWQALAVAGTVGFTTAIGVHPVIGYNSVTHLAPAVLGALLFFIGLTLAYARMRRSLVNLSSPAPV